MAKTENGANSLQVNVVSYSKKGNAPVQVEVGTVNIEGKATRRGEQSMFLRTIPTDFVTPVSMYVIKNEISGTDEFVLECLTYPGKGETKIVNREQIELDYNFVNIAPK